MLPHKQVVQIGKVVRQASRLRGGSGSALPGLVVEKIDPDFAARTLETLPHGIVIVSGTNGKTTTTKIICHLLEAAGLKVFTNKSGSNFTRGIIASLLAEVDGDGKLDADIAVLELDEAYAVQFVKRIRPRYTLLLNVMRDQLDRFGEIDHTADLLRTVATHTTDAVVLNRDDPLIYDIRSDLATQTVLLYGIDPALHSLFPSDQQLYGAGHSSTQGKPPAADVTLTKIDGTHAWFQFDTHTPKKVSLKLHGVYNLQNAAGALCLARHIVGDEKFPAVFKSIEGVRPAFGRGEAISIDGKPLEIILVKNPAGFRLALQSYDHKGVQTMIAINDNYADGRDMSWLWDVDFRCFKKIEIVSGIRAYDMALRLQYDEVVVSNVEPQLSTALSRFLSGSAKHRRIFCTYTAMMHLRKQLAKKHNIKAIDV